MRIRTAVPVAAALAAGLTLTAAPAAPAADPCLAAPSVENCEGLPERATAGTPAGRPVSAVLYYAENPEEIIVCVRECGPPT